MWTALLLNVLPQGLSVKGYVHCAEHDHYLPAASIMLQPGERHLQSDGDGFFSMDGLERGNYLLTVQYIGYETLRLSMAVVQDTLLHLHLHPSALQLKEVTVEGRSQRERVLPSSLAVEEIGRLYLLQHNAVSFANTLSALPGLSSMDIGAGFSKPVIRGLGFNRVAVADRGIVQQNQQWGADHGLEIDQYDVDNVRVHKGPMSLFFGSDAMGGVIEILPPTLPEHDGVWGEALLTYKSNNDLYGTSVVVNSKKGAWYLRGRATLQSYADYRLPADTVTYLSWQLPIHDRRMKNTAGRERNLSLSANYDNGRINSWLHASLIGAKNGFFPGAHGVPSLSRLQPDGEARNMEMPFSTSNHFKLISNNKISLSRTTMQVDLGYQRNRREELSPFHTHYGTQPPPATNPDLELRFLLDTYSTHLRLMIDEEQQWRKTIGLAGEYQHNWVGGYSFLLPAFDRWTTGAYWLNEWVLGKKISLTGGVRYDVGSLIVEGYYDPLLAYYLRTQQQSEEQVLFYAERAEALQRHFGDWSGAVGFTSRPDGRQTIKMNIGKSFRYPSANELASNGVHHGAFRHEKGEPTLTSESSFQWDMEYRLAGRRWEVTVSPFLSWFNNYIYLEPSGEWSVLPHTGQVYRYRQAEAVMGGGEVAASYAPDDHWRLSSDLEYIYNKNMTDHYPLPFSPPTTVTSELAYSGAGGKSVAHYMLRLEHRWIFAQERVARNEDPTPGTQLWNLSASIHWLIGRKRVFTDLQVQNILDRPFLNHLSFYRRLNLPEPGRNMQLIVRVPF
jgi:iron complex outermembrane receptor protein